MRVVLDYEELGGLSDPGTRDCARGVLLLRYGMGQGCDIQVLRVKTH
jgi:hypothetical protein